MPGVVGTGEKRHSVLLCPRPGCITEKALECVRSAPSSHISTQASACQVAIRTLAQIAAQSLCASAWKKGNG